MGHAAWPPDFVALLGLAAAAVWIVRRRRFRTELHFEKNRPDGEISLTVPVSALRSVL